MDTVCLFLLYLGKNIRWWKFMPGTFSLLELMKEKSKLCKTLTKILIPPISEEPQGASLPWEMFLYSRKERDFKFTWNRNHVKIFLLHKIFLLITYATRWAIWGLIDYVATLCLGSLTVYDIHSCVHFSQCVARWSV